MNVGIFTGGAYGSLLLALAHQVKGNTGTAATIAVVGMFLCCLVQFRYGK
jgi:predicted MFS family arabinose efflux permease